MCAETGSSRLGSAGTASPFKTPAARQARGLEGRAILAVHRTGKHIVCELGPADGSPLVESVDKSSAQWIVHLGMTGRLLVTTPDAPVAAHTHAPLRPWTWQFGDGATAVGWTVTHAYARPGRWRIAVEAYWPPTKQWIAFDQVTIVVAPAAHTAR